MENEYILAAAGIQPQAIAEIQSWEFSPVYPLFHANGWDASAFNPMMSSPVGLNPPLVSNDSVLIRELIRKLDGFGGNSEEIARSSCYSTPLSSPLNSGKSVTPSENSNLAQFAADPGFAERAARFSCFGRGSFSGRTGPYIGGRVEFHQGHSLESATAGDVRLGQVSSSPSLNGLGLGPQPGIGIQGPLGQLDRINLTESPEEQSSVIEPVPSGETGPRNSGETNPRKRKGVANRGKAKEPAASASKVIQGSGNSRENSNAKRCKSNVGDDRDKEGGDGEGEGEGEEKQNKSEEKQLEPPKDYIHVRARRGQATDSHSLAERVRREKISERMKLLQDLVPSCNKVTGKALMLDEIINYVQSLQRQVEFLSMKLASVNTRPDVANEDSLVSKDRHRHHHLMLPSNNALPHHMFPGDTPPTPSILPYQGFSSGGDDLQTIVQMGLGQSSLQDTTTPFHPQRFHY